MKTLDKEQLEAIKSFFGISSDLMVEHLKQKGLIKEDFELGKWYKHSSGGYWFLKEITDEDLIIYGFTCMMKWINESLRDKSALRHLAPATDKEVETALIKEAKKRGFKEGMVNINCLLGGREWDDDCGYGFDFNGDYLELGAATIFKDGKWATIIEKEPLNEMNNVLDEAIEKLTKLKTK